jgi:hypothetical protein
LTGARGVVYDATSDQATGDESCSWRTLLCRAALADFGAYCET